MNEQTDEQLRHREEADAIRDMILSKGWRILKPLIKDAVDTLKAKRDMTEDPATVMACVRQEDGILLINEIIVQILSNGDLSLGESEL